MLNFTDLSQKITGVALFLANTIIFSLISSFILRFFWILAGENYVYQLPVGGDYFNALTYLAHFAKHLPHPASGWLPFSNGGFSIIESYPPFIFYFISPLAKSLGLTTSMNAFSIVSLALFFIGSLLLFFKISKDWFLASTLVLVEMITQASYYQLTVGGFILSSSAQWYLPFVLFFILNFNDNKNFRYLLLASVLTGLSLLHHAPTGFLMTLLPASLVLFFLARGERLQKKTFLYLAIFTSLSIFIGFIGIYNVLQKTFLGVGADNCANPQCWGIYPKHLQLWMNPIAPALILSQLIILAVIILFKKKVNLFLILPTLAGLSIFVGFALAAYLKLINGLANVIFPTRTFWAANLFLLMLTASLFGSFKKHLHIFSHLFSIIIFACLLIIILTKPPIVKTDRTNTIPDNVSTYILPEFQKSSVSELVPDWILNGEKNWRIDIFSPYLLQWFNIVSEIPTTGGYSNKPLGVHQDWLYFLQDSTRSQSQDQNHQLVKNRALFLLDAYGVKFVENSQISLSDSIVDDSKLIKRSQKLRDFEWYELTDETTTPIVSPTNSPPVLFIGNSQAYESFIRTLAMTNINSKIFIPVRGPQSISKITKVELSTFPVIFLYQYSGRDFEKLTKYVKDGGHVYIETGSQQKIAKENLPEIFPVQSTDAKNVNESAWQLPGSKFDPSLFSALSYKGGPWHITAATELKNWAEPILLFDNKPVIAKGQLGKGQVVWSGFNFPFHIVDNNNFEEAKLFNDLLISLVEPPSGDPVQFKVERQKPEIIEIDAANTNGIYFKENYHSGWKAKVNNKQSFSSNKTAKIYRAGLDFMYIPTSTNDQILLEFKGGFVNWAQALVSAFSLTLSLIMLVYPKFILLLLSPIHFFWKNKASKVVTKLLEDE